ncbi:ethanolamine ammonia-lyase reactivating factor EutA [Rhodoplanes sp. Z2-YC6860]|uniref:ethanolamine ammonia-lyase reactivating factor EutA n=1 Tax=Rhodoplanes sp. Z2-YC6860 TaxID=674703 RepID=UPI00078EF7CC|nr:ethanolamine ammonia-lyase reactivating factor EutA [Rhodoplanes sp. Z2-YC6860]AMN38600.1 ethanolamine utilization protein eutA [Rhodoplanes sp. Z2-YC6860]
MPVETDDQGGRVFFSSTGRSLEDDDQVVVLSVGVDIGSSTSHLVFSRIVLERLDSRYVVTERETFYASDILLTPYSAENTIDAAALGAFIRKEYADAKVEPDEIDTGALILTGVAVQRKNARAIGELFAKEAGKLVAVSAGDSLETVMAAYGSGAVARSIRDECTVMNIDVGGGTSKIAICAEGKVIDAAAVDVGARLVCLEADGKIIRVEEAGRRYGLELGLDLKPGGMLTLDQGKAIAGLMADRLIETMRGGSPTVQGVSLLRTEPLKHRGPIAQIQFSGGVSEFIYGNESQKFGDLGPLLAAEIRARAEAFCPNIGESLEGIRATVVGASQYTVQLSGSTIYVAPLDAVPLRNVPVIAPALQLDGETIDPAAVASATQAMLKRLDLNGGEQPVAVFVPWQGSATFQRLDAFCRGVVDGLENILKKGHPLVLAGDGDVGGLLGIHLHEEMKIRNAVVSIDGLELKEFDYIDIGTMLETTGAVPVVIKSLIFPGSAARVGA